MFEALEVEKLSPLKNWADKYEEEEEEEEEEVSVEELGSTRTQTSA
jgi:hypothetical protein